MIKLDPLDDIKTFIDMKLDFSIPEIRNENDNWEAVNLEHKILIEKLHMNKGHLGSLEYMVESLEKTIIDIDDRLHDIVSMKMDIEERIEKIMEDKNK